MKAWILEQIKTPELLQLKEVSKPVINENEVLIETRALSLNPVDYKITQGAFNLPTPRCIGVDVSGVVVETGGKVTSLTKGDRVCGLVNIFKAGGFAEYVPVDAGVLTKLPEDLSFEDASVIPCAGITAWQACVQKINIRPGQIIFIASGGGGVGSFAIQLAKQQGAKVITAASKEHERLKALGADVVIDYHKTDVVKEVIRLTDGRGVDYILGMVSSVHTAGLAPMLRFNGCMVCITGLPQAYPFPSFTKSYGMQEVALIAAYSGGDQQSLTELAEAGTSLARLLSERKLTASILEKFSFGDLSQGLHKLAQGHASGKIVVVL